MLEGFRLLPASVGAKKGPNADLPTGKLGADHWEQIPSSFPFDSLEQTLR